LGTKNESGFVVVLNVVGSNAEGRWPLDDRKDGPIFSTKYVTPTQRTAVMMTPAFIASDKIENVTD
jgi:hypothetical protein